jgi:hypothetical protein
VPVNSQAPFRLARDLLIAYFFAGTHRANIGKTETISRFQKQKWRKQKAESRNWFQLS